MPVTLRPADTEDAERLLAWRNDPGTRRSSWADGTVDPAEHAAWLARRLADAATLLLIAEDGGAAIGQVRVDREAGAVGIVSLTVAPEARGHGLAPRVLRALSARPEVEGVRLRALIKPGNAASLRAFVAAGYREVAREVAVVTLERGPA